MRKLVIIKLGGSVITDKSKPQGVFRRSVVDRLVREIKEAKSKENFDLILVHGAGSFGHPIAKKYRLAEGLIDKSSLVGLSLCRAEMLRLKSLILAEFTMVGISADIVDTSSVAQTNNKAISVFDLNKISALLAERVVPILSGDVVSDSKQGITILSGDAIVTYLALKFKAKRVVYVTDVDGVFDTNPKLNKKAKLIKEISVGNYKEVIGGFQSSGNSDVTGEMKGKIEILKKYLLGVEIFVVNGFGRNNLRDVLVGESVGTRIVF